MLSGAPGLQAELGGGSPKKEGLEFYKGYIWVVL